MKLHNSKIIQFQNEILSWYETHQRDLPWRKTREPYSILVSEVMSQQTQLSRVIPKYITWMRQLPTVESLTFAESSVVLRLWSGLGYNRRALFLQKAVQVIVREYASVWPREVEELKKLPGIGEYTASAIACFAFNQQIPVIDTNVRKVILLRFGEYIEKSMLEVAQVEKLAWQILPHGKAYKWNQALMDYSALVLKKEKVPVAKQSKFLGSRRSYRGRVLKLLVKHHSLPFEQLWSEVQDSHIKDEDWFREILAELIREGMIKQQNDTYFL